MMQVTRENDYVVRIFDSTEEVAHEARRACEGRDDGAEEGLLSERWIGRKVLGWKHGEQLLRETWPEGLSTIEEMRSKLEGAEIEMPLGKRRKLRLSDEEGEVDVQRFLDGDEFYLRRAQRVSAAALRRVIVTFSPAANCSVEHYNLFWRGAAISAVSDILETAGYQVELWAWWHGTNAYPDERICNHFTAWKVKEAGDPVDLNNLANAVSPWFFRGFLLGSLHCTQPNAGKYNNGGVSRVYSRTEYHIGEMGKHLPIGAGDITLELPGDCLDEESAINAARNLIESLGCVA